MGAVARKPLPLAAAAAATPACAAGTPCIGAAPTRLTTRPCYLQPCRACNPLVHSFAPPCRCCRMPPVTAEMTAVGACSTLLRHLRSAPCDRQELTLIAFHLDFLGQRKHLWPDDPPSLRCRRASIGLLLWPRAKSVCFPSTAAAVLTQPLRLLPQCGSGRDCRSGAPWLGSGGRHRGAATAGQQRRWHPSAVRSLHYVLRRRNFPDRRRSKQRPAGAAVGRRRAALCQRGLASCARHARWVHTWAGGGGWMPSRLAAVAGCCICRFTQHHIAYLQLRAMPTTHVSAASLLRSQCCSTAFQRQVATLTRQQHRPAPGCRESGSWWTWAPRF